ncbi:PEP-CTERM sorting domain-containing protein [Phycisphaerales bacterium AB-hyl4]|uniref:PEP-CTERM sorting domain-containing protein n=1 Tax=Natronomicrosphaera hydrolytica TaxID=3242702 RepID=A0ABV4TZC0_9BACT
MYGIKRIVNGLSFSLLVAAGVACGTQAYAAPISQPYNDDFTGYNNGDAPANATVHANAYDGVENTFNIQGDAMRWDIQVDSQPPASNPIGSAAWQVTNMDAGSLSSFTVSTTLNLVSQSASAGNKEALPGLVLFGENLTGIEGSASHGAGNNFYWATYQVYGLGNQVGNIGRMQISGGGQSTLSGTFAFDSNNDYTLTVHGTYNELGHLTLEYTVSDGVTTSSVLSFTDTTPLTGEYFGLRGRMSGGADTQGVVVDYHNFTVVPEPASLGLVALGSLMMLSRRLRTRGGELAHANG